MDTENLLDQILNYRVGGARQNFCIFSLYGNPGLDERINECLFVSIAAVQADDVCASFLFLGDLNCHNQEWLGSMATNLHNVASFDFITVFGWDQLVVAQPLHVVVPKKIYV